MRMIKRISKLPKEELAKAECRIALGELHRPVSGSTAYIGAILERTRTNSDYRAAFARELVVLAQAVGKDKFTTAGLPQYESVKKLTALFESKYKTAILSGDILIDLDLKAPKDLLRLSLKCKRMSARRSRGRGEPGREMFKMHLQVARNSVNQVTG